MNDKNPDADQMDDALMGAITADLTPAQFTTDRRNQLRARMLSEARNTAPPGTYTIRKDHGPWQRLNSYIEFRTLRVDSNAGTQTLMLKVAPGGQLPGHYHRQEEELFVLEGECMIGNHKLAQGDAHFVSAGEYHDSITSATGVTLLLRTDYPAMPA